MGCCGHGRAALVQGQPSARQAPAQQTASQQTSAQQAHAQQTPPAGTSSVRIEFVHQASVLIRGPATGRHYQFHAAARTRDVDPRDAPALVKSGYFKLA